MITDSFDNSSIITSPEKILRKGEKIADTVICTFSCMVFDYINYSYSGKIFNEIRSCNGSKHIIKLNVDFTTLISYMLGVGATSAGNEIIELYHLTDIKNIVVFGSCGILDKGLEKENTIIVPTEAYRDEGMSYHYMKPSDYITITKSDETKDLIEKQNSDYKVVQGRVWTTDAFYHETEYQRDKRKQEGCLAVEMEIAGMQAVCNYYNINLFPFLVLGDLVDTSPKDYNPEGLHSANHCLSALDIALSMAIEIENSK